MINLNVTTYKAFYKLFNLDTKFVGTINYMGVAYFWNYEYRHYLRDASTAKRIKVHNAFLNENLDVSGTSERHFEIIKSITKIN